MSTDTIYDLNLQIQIAIDYELPGARMQRAVEWVLRTHDVPSGTGVSLVVTDDAEIRRLNRQFRAVDALTDVLSFSADPAPVPEGVGEHYLGDLVLALPYIQRQAEVEGHTLSDELVLAVIHGTLHLLGYDHDTLEHQLQMWATQAKALHALGVMIIVPEFGFSDD